MSLDISRPRVLRDQVPPQGGAGDVGAVVQAVPESTMPGGQVPLEAKAADAAAPVPPQDQVANVEQAPVPPQADADDVKKPLQLAFAFSVEHAEVPTVDDAANSEAQVTPQAEATDVEAPVPPQGERVNVEVQGRAA